MKNKMLYSDLLPKTNLTESSDQQLDEISLDQIGRGIGGVLGGIGKTAGAVAGVPQGIGRAIKKGYRGSVKGIGGEDDAGSLVPGAAAGEKKAGAEMPIGSGTINPATGRAYVPSDFASTPAAAPAADTGTGTRTADDIKADLRKLDAAYKMRRNALNQELEGLDSAPTGSATGGTTAPATGGLQAAIAGSPQIGGQPETISIGGQKIAPTDPLYSKIAAKSGVMQNQPLVRSIQALDKQKLETVKQILQQKIAGKLEEAGALGALARGASNLVKGAALGMKNPQAAANLSKNPNTGTATKIGRNIGRGAVAAKDLAKKGLSATGKAIAAAPRVAATAAGATRGAFAGMGTAYAKGKQAGEKFVGQGPMSWDDLQVELANLDMADAKALLSFINQLGVGAAAPAATKAPVAKKPAKPRTGAAGKVPGYTGPASAAAAPVSATVHESLTWSKNFDPSRHLITQLNRS